MDGPNHMTTPDPTTGPDDDLAGVVHNLIPSGLLESLIRTWVPVGIGSVLAWAAVHWHIVVDPGASATAATVATALCIAGYYALARVVERRWPRAGRWLVALNLVRSRPIYAGATEAVRLIDTSTGTVRRVDPSNRP